MPIVTVYSTDACASCTRAKALLDKRGLAHEEINLSRDADARARLVEQTGRMTYPQILVGDTVVGGFEELVAAERSGRLAALLAEAA